MDTEKDKTDRRGSSSRCSAVTARATCFNRAPLRAAKCVYKPADCVLACFLPPRISVRASLSAPLLRFLQERQRTRQRETGRGDKRLEEQRGFFFIFSWQMILEQIFKKPLLNL